MYPCRNIFSVRRVIGGPAKPSLCCPYHPSGLRAAWAKRFVAGPPARDCIDNAIAVRTRRARSSGPLSVSCPERVMRPEPWLQFWGMNAPSDRKAVLDCLAGAGIRTRAFDSNQASGDGILCVAHLNDDVCEFVRELNPRHDRVSGAADRRCGRGQRAGLAAAARRRVGRSGMVLGADIAERIKARFERWHADRRLDSVTAGPGQADWRQRRVALGAAPDRRGGPLHLRLSFC